MKNLKKLVAVSAAALTLAGVGATTANAAFVIDGKTYDPHNIQIESMSQAEYINFIQEVAAKINELALNRTPLRNVIADAQAAYDNAETAYNDAVAERDELRAELAEATADRRAKAARRDELAEVLRLVDRDFDAEKRVAAEVREDEAAANLYARNSKVEALANSRQAAADALESANQEVDSAAADVAAYQAVAGTDAEWTADEVAAADARLANALDAQGTAAANYSAAQAAEVNGTATAEAEYTAAETTSVAKYEQTLREIEAAYTDAQNIYKQYGIQGDAERAHADAVAAYNDAVAKEGDLQAALNTAETNVNNTLAAKDNAYAALRAAQRNHAVNEEKLAEYELALHQAVVDGNINSNTNLENLTQEEIDTIERVRGIQSSQLEKTLEEATREREDLEKEQEDGVEGAKPDTDGEGNEVDPGESDDENESEDEGSKDEDDKDGDKDHGKNKGKKDKKVSGQAELPETGESSSYAIFGAAALAVLAGVGLVAPSFKKEN